MGDYLRGLLAKLPHLRNDGEKGPAYALTGQDDDASVDDDFNDDNEFFPTKTFGGIHPAQQANRRSSNLWFWIVGGLVSLVLLLAAVIGPFHKTKDVAELVPNQDIANAATTKEHRKAVVMASYTKQPIKWLDELNSRPGSNGTDHWEVYRYVNDAPKDSDYLKVDNPDGRETLAYLTFIIDNYDNLPDSIVFTHGHNKAWHQPTPLRYKLWALNTTALEEEGYFNIRCSDLGCTEDSMWYVNRLKQPRLGRFTGMWEEMMEPMFGPIPNKIGLAANAQFAASKEAILAQPIDFWLHLRDPLLRKPVYDHPWIDFNSSYILGLFYEPLWHVFMGKPAIFCPGNDTCNRRFFSNKIRCDHPPPKWLEHWDWMNNKCEYHEEGLDGFSADDT